MELDIPKGSAEAPHLVQRKAFETLLSSYRISHRAEQVLKQVRLVLLVGPTSAGRNTIIERLVTTGEYHFIVSDTTRPPRMNNGVLEQNGQVYWFRSEDEMLSELRRGEFLEAEIIHGQQVSGISIRELDKAMQEQKIAITEVDIGGISNILHLKPDTNALAILPPSFEEWQRRLIGRGSMDVKQLKRRLETAARIFTAASEDPAFTLVVNDSIDNAVTQVHAFVEKGIVTPGSQENARALALSLRNDTLAYLESL